MIVKIRKQKALGIAFGVVKLAIFQRPEERQKPAKAQNQRDWDQPEQDCHFTLKAFSDTRIDEVDIASAATSGEASPAIAKGTEIRL